MNGKYKLIIIAILGLILFNGHLNILAQTVILWHVNHIPANCTISTKQVEYIDLGVTGKNMLWDFSKLHQDTKKTEVHTYAIGDTAIAISSYRSRYIIRDLHDSLFVMTAETPLIKIDYSAPILRLVYPFKYGDKTSKEYEGHGLWCNVKKIDEYGLSKVEADASGSIIMPSSDTIRNVLRVHERRDAYIEVGVGGEESHIRLYKNEDVCSWYAEGECIPVFQTSCKVLTSQGDTLLEEKFAQQYEPLKVNGAESVNSYNEKGAYNITQQLCMNDYAISLKGSTLVVEYRLNNASTVEFILSNTMGVVYQKILDKKNNDNGEVKIDLSGLHQGQYVLYIKVKNEVYSEKITYK